MAPSNSGSFILSDTVVSRTDLMRAISELQQLSDHLMQASIREDSSDFTGISPVTTQLLSDNGIDPRDESQRQNLLDVLDSLKTSAPIIHISFATEPSVSMLQKLLGWFRTEVHPHLLLKVGLQPDIAAGCIVRTTSRYFDFSLRKNLSQNKKLLVDLLEKSDAQC